MSTLLEITRQHVWMLESFHIISSWRHDDMLRYYHDNIITLPAFEDKINDLELKLDHCKCKQNEKQIF